jgi:hypothetical protein
MGTLASTHVKIATGKSMKPSDFYPPTRKKRIQLSPRQEQQLKEKRKREKAKAKVDG